MRLLEIHSDGSFSLVERFGDNIPPYAILSHTWGSRDEEVSFQDMENGSGKNKLGYEKIVFCGRQAAEDGLDYFWVDTCCIDKTSSAELSEAINSMYVWYQAARVCYAYLSDVTFIGTRLESRWFTRGWTLQELIAPAKVIFYNRQWKWLGTKLDLALVIKDCTDIPALVLRGPNNLDSFSVAQKMSWAARRQTTRVEDRAYCLLGVFGINMPLMYGEGENAFIRLQEEVMKITDDHTLFAWQSQDDRGGCLATSPSSFRLCADVVQTHHLHTLYDAPSASSRGVQMELKFQGRGPGRLGIAVLNCCREGQEDEPFVIYLRDLSFSVKHFERVHTDTLHRIKIQNSSPSSYSIKKLYIRSGRPNGKAINQGTCGPAPSPLGFEHSPMLLCRIESAKEFFDILNKATDDETWLLLTRAGIRVNMQDEQGQTALSYAASKGLESVVRMLLGQTDIDVNLANDRGRTPLSFAAANGKLSTVMLLLDDIRVDTGKTDAKGNTPRSWAAFYGHSAIVNLLLKRPPFVTGAPNGTHNTRSLE